MNDVTFPLVIENYSLTGTVIDEIIEHLKENITISLPLRGYEPRHDVVSNGMIELKTLSTFSDTTFSKELTASQIRKLEALEAVAGILNDLSPQQLKAFESSVKRRPLFK